MRQALKNRNIAILVMVVLIILGLIFGTRVGLTREKRNLQQMFSKTEFDGATVEGRINAARRDADALCGAAVQIVGQDDAFYKTVKDDIDKMLSAKTVYEKYYTLNKMCSDAKILRDTAVAAAKSSGKSPDDVIRNYANIQNMSELLDEFTAEYNDAVDAFNTRKHMFPCNVLAAITFVKDAEKYR